MPREAASKIAKDRVVTLELELTDERGEVLEKATSDAPFVYLHGHDAIARALEEALEGREEGERFKTEIAPEELVGSRVEDAVRVLPVDGMPEGVEPRVGMTLPIDEDGERFDVWVTAVNEHHVVVSLEHAWAGRSVTMVAEVLKIRDATEDELAAGEPAS